MLLILLIILLLFAQSVIFGVLCFKIARNRHLDPVANMWLGFVFGVIGLIIVCLKQPTARSVADAMIYHHSHDLTDPSYRVYLTRKFNIEHNSTLDQYVAGDSAFDTLEQALEWASEEDVRAIGKAKIRIEEENSNLKVMLIIFVGLPVALLVIIIVYQVLTSISASREAHRAYEATRAADVEAYKKEQAETKREANVLAQAVGLEFPASIAADMRPSRDRCDMPNDEAYREGFDWSALNARPSHYDDAVQILVSNGARMISQKDTGRKMNLDVPYRQTYLKQGSHVFTVTLYDHRLSVCLAKS